MFKLTGFNADQVIEETKDINMDFEPLPGGEYNAVVKEAEEKETNDGLGSYIKTKNMITSGEYKGRFYWDMFNWVNKNELCVKIGKKMFAQLCKAINVNRPDSLDDITGREFVVKLKVKPARGEYGPSNAAVVYKAVKNPREGREEKAETKEDAPFKSDSKSENKWS